MNGYRLLENASLAGRNSLRVPARAELLIDLLSADALPELLAMPLLRRSPLHVLGGGSNLLLAADLPGVCLSPVMHDIRFLVDHDRHALVRAEAGVIWNDLVHWTLGHGLCGLENLVLIPGTVGAAPIQNIGAYGVEVGDSIEVVEAWDRVGGTLRRLGRDECAFAYRDSRFKRETDRWIITAVEFRLHRAFTPRLDYPGVRDELARMQVTQPRAAHVAEAIARIRTRKLPDPAYIGNVGSFFQNPIVPKATAEALRHVARDAPIFSVDADRCKLSAAWLIEQCGFKGARRGDAGVYAGHALVLVNHGRASGADILALAREIAAAVYARFAVALTPEPRILGASW